MGWRRFAGLFGFGAGFVVAAQFFLALACALGAMLGGFAFVPLYRLRDALLAGASGFGFTHD